MDWAGFLALSTVEREPRPLPTLEAADRPVLFEQALERFCGLLPPAARRPAPRYGAEELPAVLFYVLLLAMLAAEGTRVDRPADPGRIMEYAWSRERDAWRRHLHPLFAGQPEERLGRAVDAVEDLAVVATLGRVFADVGALEDFLRAHCRPVAGVGADELAERIPALFPRAEGMVLPPIAPDPLADFVVERRLAARAELVSLALPRAGEAAEGTEAAVEAAGRAVGVLARLWERAADEGARERVAG